MNQPVHLAVNGASGRMGQVLLAELGRDERFKLLAEPGSHSDWQTLPEFDVLLDFSTPQGLRRALAYCLEHGVALVSGSTGLDAYTRQAMADAGKHIALMHAVNFSLGMAVLERLLASAAHLLRGWDLEILEAHHAGKQDAPSGSALALGQAAAAARNVQFDEHAVYARHARSGTRGEDEIGFASIRAGDIVGEHSAVLATAGERIELAHRATDRAIFARGALHACAWIAGRKAGYYRLADMLVDSA